MGQAKNCHLQIMPAVILRLVRVLAHKSTRERATKLVSFKTMIFNILLLLFSTEFSL